jgi:hypothetical protein
MMVHSAPHSVVSRLLSVATVLTLVGFAASADLQPQRALASSGESANLGAGVVSLADDANDNADENNNGEHRDDNGNGDKNRNDENRKNNDENRNHDENNDENRENNDNQNNNENHEQSGNTGGQGIFSTICAVPGFANNIGCATGLLGN